MSRPMHSRTYYFPKLTQCLFWEYLNEGSLFEVSVFSSRSAKKIHPKTMMIGRLATRSAARAVARPAMASSFRAQAVRALASSTSPILSEAAAIPQDPAMFCRQCEQAREGVGCSTIGVCGKSPEASNAQDALVHFIKSVSSWCVAARDAGATAQDMAEANAWTLKAAFATLTNVNFSEVRNLYMLKGIQLARLLWPGT